jgi:adenylate cyclase
MRAACTPDEKGTCGRRAVADLIAQGPLPDQRWRRKLRSGMSLVVGRQSEDWSVPWDDRISRRHVTLTYEHGRLRVEVLPAARNPVFFRGTRCTQFQLRPGEHFVIGQTTFTLVDEPVQVTLDVPKPTGERTFTVGELRRQPFREVEKRVEALCRLPEILREASSDQELIVRLVNVLLSGITRATAVAIVAAGTSEPGSTQAAPPVEVLHWDRRILASTEFRPSERLIRAAIRSGASVVHVWSGAKAPRAPVPSFQSPSPGEVQTPPPPDHNNPPPGEPPGHEAPFTLSEGTDWALCTPVPEPASAGWAIYVAGSFEPEWTSHGQPTAEWLRDDVKFTELTAATLGGLRQARMLAARQAALSQFFSPPVLEAIASRDPEEALAPREADVTVLFCDLRGFTHESERSAGNLFELLQRVSQALGVMTRQILDWGGVVGDFHGDAAMGFWGWPLPQPDAVERACRAALAIRAAFQDQAVGSTTGTDRAAGSEVRGFRVGIGIASGRAVAGKIGTVDQVKVTVFGPVVNLASRLETMTRQLGASILIDPKAAAVLRSSVASTVCRVRRLARVRPVGLSAPIEVSELLPPARDCLELSDEHLADYEAALEAFERGDWNLALRHLHRVPPEDVATDFLTFFITQHARTPPPHWDGVITLREK